MIHRRNLLISAALLFTGTSSLTRATIIRDHLPWEPYPSSTPAIERPGPWQFFSADEVRAMEAIVDRIIPPDPDTPGGKDAGCAVFIDRQLAGPYGSSKGFYKLGPFIKGNKQQGPQSALTPAQLYRKGLAELDKYCKANRGKVFAELGAEQQDDVLKGIEAGKIKFDDVDAEGFFGALLKNVPEGFFSDPIHGGNRDMVGWKMIGFSRHQVRLPRLGESSQRALPYPPVGIAGRAEWTPRKS